MTEAPLRPWLRVRLRHDGYGGSAPVDIVPSDWTAWLARWPGLRLRSEPALMEVFLSASDSLSGAEDITIEFRSSDPDFAIVSGAVGVHWTGPEEGTFAKVAPPGGAWATWRGRLPEPGNGPFELTLDVAARMVRVEYVITGWGPDDVLLRWDSPEGARIAGTLERTELVSDHAARVLTLPVEQPVVGTGVRPVWAIPPAGVPFRLPHPSPSALRSDGGDEWVAQVFVML